MASNHLIRDLLTAPPETRMKYVRLGNSGLKVSRAILGGMSYGSKEWGQWVLEEDEALPLLKHAYDVGINTWDTADLYSDGRSELIMGKALQVYDIPRETVVLMTKCRFGTSIPGKEPLLPPLGSYINDGRMVNRAGLSRKRIFDAVQASVRRLGGTYIDVLQVHRLDEEVSREEVMRALNDVVEKGWVRYLGASSMPAWEFQMYQNLADKHGWHKFISMQNYHNLLYREEEREMIPYCEATGVGLIPWSPVARGVLTRPWGSHKSDNKTLREETDFGTNRIVSREDASNEAIVGVVQSLAEKRGVSMAMIAMAWCYSKGVNPILGLNSKARIDEAADALQMHTDSPLTKEEVEALEANYVPKKVLNHY